MKISDAIMDSVNGIGHYWPLFLVLVISERCNHYCKRCTNSVIMIVASLIAFYDTHN